MKKTMLLNAIHPEEMRMVITDQKSTIHEFDFTTAARQQIKGNVYLAKVTRVEPSLQAAFVEYGGNKQGFLPFAEIHPDYYQIPISDRKKLLEEEEKAYADEQEPADPKRRTRRKPKDSGKKTKEKPGSDTLAEDTGLEPAPSVSADPEKQDNESAETQEVETLSSEEEIERPRRSNNFSRRYKVQEVIKRNQILLVQVIKEERGNKGVSLTTYISLAGRYCVLMPNSPRGGGVSRKINTGDDRKRLKSIISDLELPRGMSVIIRTAGSHRTRAEIKRDFDYLVKLWNQIRDDTLSSSAPALIYEESNLIKRSIRDAYSNEIEEILVEGEAAYKEAKAFMRMLVPSHAPRVKHYKDTTPLFYKYNIENQLLSMHDPVVKLRSGGYIVLNPTEALISIDVNSGRSTGERNIEETAVKTNTEAAIEIARQLRLRDLAGLVVIDFIDMLDGKNRRHIERVLKDALRSDRAKLQLGRISPFGLLELSRQRLRSSLSEAMTHTCDHCLGTGSIRSNASVAIQMIRNLEQEASGQTVEKFRVYLTPSVAIYLLNNMREKLNKIEQDSNLIVEIQIDGDLREGTFRIEKFRNKGKPQERDQHQDAGKNPSRSASSAEDSGDSEDSEEKPSFDGNRDTQGEGRPRRRRERRRRRGRDSRDGDRHHDRDNESSTAPAQDNDVPESVESDEISNNNDESSPDTKDTKTPRRRQRERGNRRRRWKDDDASGNVEMDAKPPKPQPSPAIESPAAKLPEIEVKPSLVVMQTATAEPATTGIQAASKPQGPARKGWWQKIID